LGAGCDGRFSARRRTAREADGEAVWSWHLDADAKLSGAIRTMTVTRKPDRRIMAVPVATMLVCFFNVAREAVGTGKCTRHSLRPLLFEGGWLNGSGAFAPRE
jgi:2-polyprenyl-6-methoxyphenol hydroxylase-like FAD-dependent oxidoreductase